MLVTFLVGNGFDLNQGLRTSYKEFLKKYAKVTRRDNNAVRVFKGKLLSREDLWSDCEKLLGEITECYTLNDKQDFLIGIDDLRHSMSKYLEKQSRKFKFKISRQRKELKRSLTNLFSREGYLYPYRGIYPYNNNDVYQFVVFNYNTIVYDMINKIRAKEQTRNNNKITENINTRKRLIHFDTREGFILGVNDCSQIKNEKFREDEEICNALVKANQRKIMCANEDIGEYVRDTDVVYVYGMSIGETDKRYWKQLFHWLSIKKEKKLIISIYKERITRIDTYRLEAVKNELIDRLREYGLGEEYIPQIEVVVNPQIFNFLKRKKKIK